MTNKKFKIKEKANIQAKATDEKKYKIKINEVSTEGKDKWNDGDEITITGKASIIELDPEGKETTTKKDSANATLIYKEGLFTNYFKVKEVDGKKFEDKEQKEVSTKGMNSFRYPFWIAIIVSLLALVLFIWWWISSSQKDKEGEEL